MIPFYFTLINAEDGRLVGINPDDRGYYLFTSRRQAESWASTMRTEWEIDAVVVPLAEIDPELRAGVQA